VLAFLEEWKERWISSGKGWKKGSFLPSCGTIDMKCHSLMTYVILVPLVLVSLLARASSVVHPYLSAASECSVVVPALIIWSVHRAYCWDAEASCPPFCGERKGMEGQSHDQQQRYHKTTDDEGNVI
jgi:hypothetical protein